MAKGNTAPKSFLQRPISWIVIGAVFVGVYVGLDGDPAKTTKKTTKPPLKSKTLADGVLRPEDYTAKFQTVSYKPKDVFAPLVAKGGVGSGLQGIIPILLANGESNWAYTGLVELDGKVEALLENLTSGESVYLSVGDRWKSARVKRITEDTVVLVAEGGDETSVAIIDPATAKSSKTNPTAGTLPPVTASINPNGMPLAQGPIGNLDGTAAVTTGGNDSSMNPGGGRRGNRRGRRGSSFSGGQDGSF